MKIKENETESCLDIKNKEGRPLGCVCVIASKDFRKKDLVIMPKDKPAKSVRSTTELINNLNNLGVTFEERKKIIDFTSSRLKLLDREIENNIAGVKNANKEG